MTKELVNQTYVLFCDECGYMIDFNKAVRCSETGWVEHFHPECADAIMQAVVWEFLNGDKFDG